MYHVKFASNRVKKEFQKMKGKEKQLLEDALHVLQRDPRPVEFHYSHLNKNKNVKRLKAKRARVFYIIDDSRKVIHIGKIENRDSHSYACDPKEWFQSVA